MSNESEIVRSIFNSYIADMKAYNTEQNYGVTVKDLEEVRDKAIDAIEFRVSKLVNYYEYLEHEITDITRQNLEEAYRRGTLSNMYSEAGCPNCGYSMYKDSDDWKVPYCKGCGQALKWEVEYEQDTVGD